MPFNIVGAGEATPGAGTVNLAFPQDDRYARVDGVDSIKISSDLEYLLGVHYSAIATGARALIRQPGEIDKSFLKCQLSADNDATLGYQDLFRTPIQLKVGSKLEVLSVNAGDEDTLIGLLLGTGSITPAPFTIDEIIDGFSDTTIATAMVWNPCPITWNQDLKAGLYSIVGMRASVFLAANAWATLMRLVIPGNPSWRPGVPCTIAEADHEEFQSQTTEPWTIWGDMGVTFNAPEEMPNIEVLSNALHTDENIQLMLKKVG